MKKFKLLTILFATLCFAAMISCEGPEGPTGAAGADGANGTNGIDGTDGTDGVDGNLSCLVCHTQTNMDGIEAMYALSHHYSAHVVVRGTSASCSRCHSHEGFLNYLAASPDVDAVGIDYPTRISCHTCHGNHRSLEDDIDAPMRTVAAVTALADGSSTLDLGGVSNLCMNCHQARRNGEDYDYFTGDTTFTRTFRGDDIATYTSAAVGPAGSITLNGTGDTLTVVFDIPTTNVYISSEHAGPHYGVMGNVLNGLGGYTSTTPAAPTHKSVGCVGCHMGEAGTTEGGHSFWPNLANCTAACHTDATDFNINGSQTTVDGRMAVIATALETIHAIHEEDGEYHPMYASITRAQFQAFWNWKVVQDAIHVAHNPGYTDALLDQAEANLGL